MVQNNLKKNYSVHIIYNDIFSPYNQNSQFYFQKIINGITKYCSSNKIKFEIDSIKCGNHSPVNLKELEALIQKRNADGIAFISLWQNNALEYIDNFSKPIVLIDHDARGYSIPYFTDDSFDQMHDVFFNLYKLNHKHVVYIDQVHNHLNTPLNAGYKSASEKYFPNTTHYFRPESTEYIPDFIENTVYKYLIDNQQITAVVSADYEKIKILFDKCCTKNPTLANKLSFVSFGSLSLKANQMPVLSKVAVNWEAIAHKAIEHLRHQILFKKKFVIQYRQKGFLLANDTLKKA